MKSKPTQRSQPTKNLWSHLNYHPNLKFLLRLLNLALHPIVVFVFLQIAIIATIVLWIVFYFNVQEQVTKSIRALGISRQFIADQTDILTLSIGIAFISFILVASIFLFVFAYKQKMLAWQQKHFISSITHELKSPLASLQLCLETIKKRILEDAIRDKLFQLMQSDCDRLLRMVDQILASSRLERGIKPEEKSTTLFALPFIRSACSDITRHSESAKRFEIHCLPDLKIHIPQGAFKMVLLNLLENAVKYSPPGSPIIVSVEEDRNFFILKVRDFGYGISKSERRAIFKMFHRGEVTAKKAIAGTGLGLYIAKTVVRSFGGNIWVDSKGPNLGSTFSIRWRGLPPPELMATEAEDASWFEGGSGEEKNPVG